MDKSQRSLPTFELPLAEVCGGSCTCKSQPADENPDIESRRLFLAKFASGVFAGLVAPAVLGEVEPARVVDQQRLPFKRSRL